MRQLLLLLAVLVSCTLSAKKTPQWVESKPAMDGFYVGVGSVRASDADREAKAKEKALADLVSEISVVIENRSLYQRLDENGKYSEKYSNDSRTSSKAWLEGYELVETFNDGNLYWTLYRLDKNVYEQLRQKKSAEAAQKALSFWSKGNVAIKEGHLTESARLYASGLKTLEPFADMHLEVIGDGTTMDIGVELLQSFTGLFSRLKIDTTPRTVALNANEAKSSSVLVRVCSGDNFLSGIAITAAMKPVSSKITVSGPTDPSGHATIFISDVTPKPTHRTLTITPHIDLVGLFDSPLLQSMEQRILKMIRPINVPVEVTVPGLKAIVVAADHQSDRLAKQISQYITKNYFDLAETPEDADLKIEVESSTRAGKIVDGSIYEMREFFSSANVKVTDMNSGKTVATVSIDNLRTLAPASTSVAKASADAVRELSSRIKKNLNARLSDAKFERRIQTETTNNTDNITQTEREDFFRDEYE